jgi:hypothetical protein
VTNPEPWWEPHPDLLPPEPDLVPLHARDYSVRAWQLSDDSILIRGAVMDLKPGRPFRKMIESAGGADDDRPLPIHHMVVDLVVGMPGLTITDASVVFESFPQPGCPSITSRYRELIGVSIARGFTHEVRQRFGGPRGCTHTTALLQAMGPVAVQCVFPLRRPVSGGSAQGSGSGGGVSFMRNTCHVWSEDGELWQNVSVGVSPPVALPLQRRLRDGGVDPDGWDLPR